MAVLPTSCAIERGNQSEYAVKLILQDKINTDEAIERALNNFDNVCNPDMKDYELEKKCIPAIVMGSVKEISSNFGEIISFQEEIKGDLGGYTYRGRQEFQRRGDD